MKYDEIEERGSSGAEVIAQLIAEATDVEYKVALERSRPKNWLKTVCAFANTVGGTLLFGVDDATHEIGRAHV